LPDYFTLQVPHLAKHDIDGFVLPRKIGPIGVLINVFCHWPEGFAVNIGIIYRKFAAIIVFFDACLKLQNVFSQIFEQVNYFLVF
jgi:hypothetical protein